MKIALAFYLVHLLNNCYAEPELKLVNVIFRHGDRTPSLSRIFPNDPNNVSNFYPMGFGALTNSGKLRAYKLGEFLRNRYQFFLGDVYLPDEVYARSTDYDRTKMSLQVVLAALFPPSKIQKWHDTLNWQPIPTTYLPAINDDLLATIKQSKYTEERNRVLQTEYIQNRVSSFDDFMKELTSLSGSNVTNTLDMKMMYDTLLAEKNMDLTLVEWSKDIFPNGKLLNGTLLEFDIITYDSNITNSICGKLLLKITTDILDAKNEMIPKKTKIFLYSGHEVNVISILRAFNLYEPHIPNYSSAVIIELIRDKNEYFIKILHYKGTPTDVTELNIKGCPNLCPFEKYLLNIRDILELALHD